MTLNAEREKFWAGRGVLGGHMPWKEFLAVTDRVIRILFCVRASHAVFLCFIDDIAKL